jgi:hypothetical protein
MVHVPNSSEVLSQFCIDNFRFSDILSWFRDFSERRDDPQSSLACATPVATDSQPLCFPRTKEQL